MRRRWAGPEGAKELTRKKLSGRGCCAKEDDGRGRSHEEDNRSVELAQGG
jgi:hypothetical protein